MKRGRPMKRVSDKAAAREREFDAARAERRTMANGWCEADTPACRSGAHQGAHAHHVRLRSQGGGHDVENLRWVCWDGHDWIHANPHEARIRGLYG